ncbi:UPF0753 protein [Frankliniella fusca]|uniref:UPF0753 protein n=1 Tax=Frankliniella fusca TaxID=407009 RepID=A0AAE1HQJ6_9NEOP|nr:UPF0753 protein [Frankliniella fusca]
MPCCNELKFFSHFALGEEKYSCSESICLLQEQNNLDTVSEEKNIKLLADSSARRLVRVPSDQPPGSPLLSIAEVTNTLLNQ